ncbi:AAA family ATPase [Patescibacteria group bacterium]|nr:AAA family ATPase [Patescibacteria group bacterium]
MKGIFLALIGPNGTGKTSLAKNLAKRLGWLYLKSPPKQFWRERSHIERLGDLQDRYKFYLKINKYLSIFIKKKIYQGKSVILDRYYLDTWITHNQIIQEKDFRGLLEPNLTILVTCTVKKQLKRLAKRKKLSTSEKRYSTAQLNSLTQTYRKIATRATRLLLINTDKKTKKQNLAITLDALKKLELIS